MTRNMGSQVIQENFAEAFKRQETAREVVERIPRLAVIDLLEAAATQARIPGTVSSTRS